MTGILASVNSLDEALLVLNTSVDIIDLKQPEHGALGALPIHTVKNIVQTINHRKLVSATIGDLPMQAEVVFKAVSTMAETGVDYIKIGFFPGGKKQETITKLAKINARGHQLIAVLFADKQADFSLIKSLKTAGFSGVMLDTMDKSNGSLSQIMTLSNIKNFVLTCKKYHLVCGLAGSLNIQDIPELLQLEVDYLGFRGALCKGQNRTAQLNMDAIDSILNYFEKPEITSLVSTPSSA